MTSTFDHGMAHGVPGEIVWAAVMNPFENRRTSGKPRPAVLIRRERSQWLIMGLTTNRAYGDGSPRMPVPNARAVGLTKPGYLWADHLTSISVLDVRDHIGWVDDDLARLIVATAHVRPEDADLLSAASQQGLAA